LIQEQLYDAISLRLLMYTSVFVVYASTLKLLRQGRNGSYPTFYNHYVIKLLRW